VVAVAGGQPCYRRRPERSALTVNSKKSYLKALGTQLLFQLIGLSFLLRKTVRLNQFRLYQ
jgi:hypothetical protein